MDFHIYFRLRDVLTNYDPREMYNSNMIVYGELLFIENMIIGGALLHLTGEICHAKIRRLGLLIGSLMCGTFSLVVFLDLGKLGTAKMPVMLLMEVTFAVIVCAVVFSCFKSRCIFSRNAYRYAIVFILITYFMGGITMALLLLTKQQGIYTVVGIYTGDMKAAMLAIFICLGYMTIIQIIKTVKNKKLREIHSYDAHIIIDGREYTASAFLDTGNKLKDPITGKSVAVASALLWKQFELKDEKFALIPYEAVGGKGMLRAIRTDHMEIGKKSIRGLLVAEGDKEIAGGYDLIISTEMVDVNWD